jgi:chromosome segregation ATPase
MGQGERGNDGADKQGKATKTKLADMRRRTMEAARDASGGRKDEEDSELESLRQEHEALEKELFECIRLAKAVRTEAYAFCENLSALSRSLTRFKLSGNALSNARGLLEASQRHEESRHSTLEERLNEGVIAPLEAKLRDARCVHPQLKQRRSLVLDTQAYARKVEKTKEKGSNTNAEKLESRENKLHRSREALETTTEKCKEELRQHSATNRVEGEIAALSSLLADHFSSSKAYFPKPQTDD